MFTNQVGLLYCDDVEDDWLDTWGDDNDEPTYIEKMTTFLESVDSVTSCQFIFYAEL